MRSKFNLTPNPVTLAAPGKMALSQSVDTSDQDVIVAVLTVFAASASPSYTVRLLGSMSMDSEDGWVELAAFGTLTSTATTVTLRGDRLLHYLRWEVTGTFNNLVFTVQGFLSAT